MAQDLTDSFRLAYDNAASWTPDQLNAVVHELFNRFAEALDDWDASSGEEWMQFSANGQPVLYVRANLPLAIILSGYEGVLDDIPVVLISADDFQKVRFQLDVAVMRALFSAEAAGSLNPSGFTISELWRASI